ncbi:hypothetical protein PtA15_5A445 [Puccinia triticina]|uniref:Uncharacterized protein n=1 Tax=Puccinia triticina TaxID=208348 RepID=A0ABY7CLK1_9BASI|nr:uncharacterized protein PtA15_5A445 [Puccinia triticina]WAQ84872.1 hypothetical protein PtA15_5A445 [Puccinia triticina]WAR58220.1 hypothetical protein PtB15_5B452 [Puccinia triticina]
MGNYGSAAARTADPKSDSMHSFNVPRSSQTDAGNPAVSCLDDSAEGIVAQRAFKPAPASIDNALKEIDFLGEQCHTVAVGILS